MIEGEGLVLEKDHVEPMMYEGYTSDELWDLENKLKIEVSYLETRIRKIRAVRIGRDVDMMRRESQLSIDHSSNPPPTS